MCIQKFVPAAPGDLLVDDDDNRGSEMAPSPDCSGRRRFAVACSVLSQCVRAETAAAAHSRPLVVQAQAPAPAACPMLLMPGADVVSEKTVPMATPTPTPEPASAQLTVVYGGRVLVFDNVRPETAAEVMRVADVPVARKAALQRVMEKRRDRLGKRTPYAATARATAAATTTVPKEQQEEDADVCLRLGVPGL